MATDRKTLRLPAGLAGGGLPPELTTVERVVPADEPPAWPVNSELAVIGKPTPRLDGRAKVTGAARYTADRTIDASADGEGKRNVGVRHSPCQRTATKVEKRRTEQVWRRRIKVKAFGVTGCGATSNTRTRVDGRLPHPRHLSAGTARDWSCSIDLQAFESDSGRMALAHQSAKHEPAASSAMSRLSCRALPVDSLAAAG